jgi:hypothetical protein
MTAVAGRPTLGLTPARTAPAPLEPAYTPPLIDARPGHGPRGGSSGGRRHLGKRPGIAPGSPGRVLGVSDDAMGPGAPLRLPTDGVSANHWPVTILTETKVFARDFQ